METALSNLASEGLQSDTRFAGALIRTRIAKGYGALRIRQELRLHGIIGDDPPELREIDWSELILRVHARKFGNEPPESLSERRTRERYLYRRGFGYDEIAHLFRRLGATATG